MTDLLPEHWKMRKNKEALYNANNKTHTIQFTSTMCQLCERQAEYCGNYGCRFCTDPGNFQLKEEFMWFILLTTSSHSSVCSHTASWSFPVEHAEIHLALQNIHNKHKSGQIKNTRTWTTACLKEKLYFPAKYVLFCLLYTFFYKCEQWKSKCFAK